MGHVAPHRWADLDAGKLGPAERESMERHAGACESCAAQRERVLSARGVFEEIREAEPSDLGWDHIGARVYWVTSSERRAAERGRGRRPSWRRVWVAAAAACGLAIGGLATARYLAGHSDVGAARATAHEPVRSDVEPVRSDVEPAPQPKPTAGPIVGVVTLVQGEVQSGDGDIDFDQPLRAGDVLVTGDGRVAVQFGHDSGFELGARSVLTVRSLDSRAIELGVEGVIDVDIEHRPDDQIFAVVAGWRRVEVRGTAFRVSHRNQRLDVSCLRGRVEVTDGDERLGVDAGQRLVLAMNKLAARRAADMPRDEAEQLDRSLSVPMLPVWTAPDALFSTSSTLDLRAEPGAAIEVDGVRVGDGDFRLRVMSGRHQVADTWVDLAAGTLQQTVVAARKPDTATRTADRRARRKQLQRALSRTNRVAQCLRPLEKLDLVEGSFVELDIGINEDGSQGHLNILKSNVPPEVQRCLRAVVDRISFPPGPKAELRYKLSF